MDDVSGGDLDWFRRGWFYAPDYIDITLKQVKEFTFETRNREIHKSARKKERQEREPKHLTEEHNETEGKT